MLRRQVELSKARKNRRTLIVTDCRLVQTSWGGRGEPL